MTQAFNLSQLANRVNTSGQLNVATGATGTLPIANGGTGTPTPSLVGGTNITISGSWPNQTVTAAGGGVTSLNGQTGAITNTDLFAIGSYITGRPANITSYGTNSTIAGSSLFSIPPAGSRFDNNTWGFFNSSNTNNGATQTNVGTWRCVSPAFNFGGNQALAGLWVRIS